MTFSLWEFQITLRAPVKIERPKVHLIISQFSPSSVVGYTWDEEMVAKGPPERFRRISHAEFQRRYPQG